MSTQVMRTLAIGCNHRSAPVQLREKLAFDHGAIESALEHFRAEFPTAQAVILSTCNRVEIYVARPVNQHPRIEEIMTFLGNCHQLPTQEFTESLYSYEDGDAIRHLFRVVSSLDSMVLGESEILAQVKEAYGAARQAHAIGPWLDRLFQRAIRVGKNVHARTVIATGRISVGSVAVALARQVFSRFDDKTVLMVGAGNMGELTLRHMLKTRPQRLWVTNRTPERAVELAERLRRQQPVHVEVVPFEQWTEQLAEVDIVISSTASREPILTRQQVSHLPRQRRYRSLLLIDIAVPRDIAAEVGKLDGFYLYNIDDLQSVVEMNLVQRRDAISVCYEIIERNVIEFLQNQPRQDMGTLTLALQQHLQAISEQEFQRIIPKAENLSDHDRQLISEMLHRINQKILHQPIRHLSNETGEGLIDVYADTLRTLFDLPRDEIDTSE